MAQKNPRYKTPVGTAIYPWITKADTKFNPDGEYRVKLRIPSEEAQEMMKLIQGEIDKIVTETTKAKGKKVKAAACPFSEVVDQDGQETGEIDFSFKRKASFVSKEGKKVNITIPVFDSQLNPLQDVSVYGGSKIKLSYEIIPYSTAIGTGVSLRMMACQVLELVEGGSGGTGSSYGFDAEEGYEAPAKSAAPAAPKGEDDESDEADF